jgi:CHAT domain-containing protein/tetratricopeptide (TPR) repeat protein
MPATEPSRSECDPRRRWLPRNRLVPRRRTPRFGHVAAAILLAIVCLPPAVRAQDTDDPQRLLAQAEQLAWMKAWAKAEPIYAEAQRLFEARGDHRNALYAEINVLRGELPHLSVADASMRLSAYLDGPIAQTDDALRLRCLVIKGETDEDLDPNLAEASWKEALAISERVGDAGWSNRIRGELGVVAFQLGDINASIVQLTRALAVAQSNGDAPALVRWLTLFGDGYVQLGRPQQALDFYDQALKAATAIPGLQFPEMTYVGKGAALGKLGRFSDAEQLLTTAQAAAERQGALGYEATLDMALADLAIAQQHPDQALSRLIRAADFARRSGGTRLIAEIDLDIARLQQQAHHPADADRSLEQGIVAAREMAEPLLLPRLLAARADLRMSERRYTDARGLLDEANDLLEGLMTHVSSPWVRSRVIGGMDGVYSARIRLEAASERSPRRAFQIVEEARGRSLLELLLSTPVASVAAKSRDMRTRERTLSALQVKLLRATARSDRRRLLDQIFLAEAQLAPISTELFSRTRTGPRQPLTLAAVQHALRPDEVFVEFALANPESCSLVITHDTARLQRLSSRDAIESVVVTVLHAVRTGTDAGADDRRLADLLLARMPELATHRRLIVSPDGDLHQLPFELLVDASGTPLLRSHIVSYVPSGSVLAILRRPQNAIPSRAALAVGASPVETASVEKTASTPTTAAIPRGIYDLDVATLAPLPSAADEARAVGRLLDASRSTVLVGPAATEQAVKRTPLENFDVLHFAAHGVLSTKVPFRSALLLRPAGDEDGLLQAGEILELRLRAALVTLSACDTGAGAVHGQEGVSSLVRPFLAAGAHAVVANLWSADDTFSLALMREFYTRLATGADVADALRGAKLAMLDRFGPQALPNLWSGVLAYGDGAAVVHIATRSR